MILCLRVDYICPWNMRNFASCIFLRFKEWWISVCCLGIHQKCTNRQDQMMVGMVTRGMPYSGGRWTLKMLEKLYNNWVDSIAQEKQLDLIKREIEGRLYISLWIDFELFTGGHLSVLPMWTQSDWWLSRKYFHLCTVVNSWSLEPYCLHSSLGLSTAWVTLVNY